MCHQTELYNSLVDLLQAWEDGHKNRVEGAGQAMA